jgi:hypothetical protein
LNRQAAEGAEALPVTCDGNFVSVAADDQA